MTRGLRTLRLVVVLTAVLGASLTDALAQGLDLPLRSVPLSDSTQTSQHLTLTARALGGYDNHLAPEGTLLAAPVSEEIEGGYTGFADIGLRYRRGREAKFFSVDAAGYYLSYSNQSIDTPVGAHIRARGATTIGRSTNLEVAQYASADPYVAFGAFGPLRQDLDVGTGPDANPVNGLTAQRSWATDTSAVLSWQATQRATVSANYNYIRHEFVGGSGFDNTTHAAELTFDQALNRNVSARGSYRFSDSRVANRLLNGDRPIVDNTAEAGFRYSKQRSRTRRVDLEAGAGATHIRTVGDIDLRQLEFWAPSGHASARADLGRTWAAQASYRRGVTVLDGISPEAFLADAVLLRAEGTLGRRVELIFSTGYSTGAQQVGLVTGRYDTYTAAAQARIVLARTWAAVIDYNRSDYQLSGFPAPPLGPVPEFDRNAVRIGLTYSHTLLSPRIERPTRPSGRGN